MRSVTLGVFGALAAGIGVSASAGSRPDAGELGAKMENALSLVANSDQPRVQGEFLVTINSRFAADVQSAPALQELIARGGKIIKRFRSSPTVLVRMPAQEGTQVFQSALVSLMNSTDIEGVEANAILKALAVPNDPKFSELYGLQNQGHTGGTAGADIAAVEAWEQSTGSKDVVVGVIDTGIDYNHEDLKDNYWTNPGESGLDANGQDKRTNGIDDDGNGFVDDFRGWDFVNDDNDPMDDQGHGTHCAGTIGAKGDNGIGVAGVNWDVSLVGIKFLSASGSGSLDDAIEAIEYATSLGVNLTSNSWGGGAFSMPLKAAIEEAASKGILFVAAAGNDSGNNDRSPAYPASYDVDNIISVAATDHNDDLAFFSNYGRQSVHLSAPGVSILSTSPGNKYVKLSGTSMACPHVAGAAALIWSAFPGLGYQAVKSRLVANVAGLNSLREKTIAGGRLSLPNALENDLSAPGLVSGLVLEDAGLFDFALSWAIAGDDGAVGRARAYEVRYLSEEEFGTQSWEEAEVLALVNDATDDQVLRAEISGLNEEFAGYVAVRAIDNVGNLGDFSEPLRVTLASRLFLTEFSAQDVSGVEFEGSWGVETLEDRGVVLSDSPGEDYAVQVNDSVIFPPFTGDFSRKTYLTLTSSYEFENNYDHGYVEVRADAEEWRTLLKINGSSGVKTHVVTLPAGYAMAKEVQVRLRIKTDLSVNFDGWLVDEVSVIQAQ